MGIDTHIATLRIKQRLKLSAEELIHPELAQYDPYDPNLSEDIKQLMILESKSNPDYFYRGVLRSPDVRLSAILGQSLSAADLKIEMLPDNASKVINKPLAYWLAGTDDYVPPLHTDYPERGDNVHYILEAVGIQNEFEMNGGKFWIGDAAFGMASVQELLNFDYDRIPTAGASLLYAREQMGGREPHEGSIITEGTYRDVMRYERDLKPILDWCLENDVTWLLYGFYDSGIYDR